MKLAVNFSEILIGALQKSPELPIDFIKVPSAAFPQGACQFEEGGAYRALLPHIAQPGVLSLGSPLLEQRLNPILIGKILDDTKPPYLSTHTHAKAEFFPEFKDKIHINDPELKLALKKRLLETIQHVQSQIQIPLALENSPYYSWSFGENFLAGVQPEFMVELCEEGGCEFLLDIAHARITAFYLELEVMDYIEALPLNKCREIHVSGIQYQTGVGYWDSHTELTPEDWSLVEKVLEKTSPEIITLEYGGFADQVYNPFTREQQACVRNEQKKLLEMIGALNEIREGRKLKVLQRG